MPNRHGNAGYRYGYQGSEKDNEVKGNGNSYTTEYRQLDPRLGRWLSIDPKATAWESPYVSMGNNPIMNNDPDGDTIKIEGSFFFRVRTKIGLASLMTTKAGRDEIMRIHSKTYTVTLRQVDNQFSHNGKGDIEMDPSQIKGFKGLFKNKHRALGFSATIGHELIHAEQFHEKTLAADKKAWVGTYDGVVSEETRGIPSVMISIAEIRATNLENTVYAEKGKPLRLFYYLDHETGLPKQQIVSDNKSIDASSNGVEQIDYSTIKKSRFRGVKFLINLKSVSKIEGKKK